MSKRKQVKPDPFGHVWHLATHIEELSKAEMKKRAARAAAGE